MTPIHPSQVGRCREKRTVLLVGEGPMEWAFLRHVVQLFHDRSGPVAARTDNAHGGSPETVIQTARKLLRQRAFDACVILMDTDRPWPAGRPGHIGRTRIEYLAAAPCLEGLLLRIIGHAGITATSTVEECKRGLYDGKHVDWDHRTEAQAYAKSFPKDLLLKRRGAVAAQLGKTAGQLKSQELLTAGMLTPAHLLDILQNFVLFAEDNGKRIKIIPRYQQFRAVHKTIHRLTHGRTRIETGDMDERGGVIWQTQGSGKSITMVFLVRKMRRDRANTERIFGPMIDHYGMTQSVEDEATVRILYEGRIPEGLIERALELDRVAKIRFREYSDADLQIIMGLYATQRHVLEAPKLIAAKADDMLRHYVFNIMPEGFKAQVVATSRKAAVRYQASLQEARDRLVAAIEGLPPAVLAMSETEQAKLDEETQYLLAVRKQLALIKRLEFAAIISGEHNDDPAWKAWSDLDKRDEYERRFKLPLEHADPEKCSGLAFLCVQNMLLTGFDAPVEQVIYLDRFIREHTLLQAIARVNRKKRGKTVGYVVDYIGIGRVLKEALTWGGIGTGSLWNEREHPD